ncbi:MAG: CDGSH iron-sulfur domain-containing protein [Flavobacteriaceae bacterium]|nr:CDGSH iron-sulfur domain-containing protein [Flavobacteriaceae bacterium]
MATPDIPKKSPYIVEVEPGKYFWCACGKSNKQPYCDGSHKGTDFNPIPVDIEAQKPVAWCGCKHSDNGAFCDGSHKKL